MHQSLKEKGSKFRFKCLRTTPLTFVVQQFIFARLIFHVLHILFFWYKVLNNSKVSVSVSFFNSVIWILSLYKTTYCRQWKKQTLLKTSASLNELFLRISCFSIRCDFLKEMCRQRKFKDTQMLFAQWQNSEWLGSESFELLEITIPLSNVKKKYF
jgi:hypothetical protein